MRKYEKKNLIAIHLPKSGGTSFGKILRQWYSPKLYFFMAIILKVRYRRGMVKEILSNQFREGICIYGHFNKAGVALKILS